MTEVPNITIDELTKLRHDTERRFSYDRDELLVYIELRKLRALIETAEAHLSEQQEVVDWLTDALGAAATQNAPERALRTTEEAIELAQACGVDAESLHRLVDYVFARPVGNAAQEVAGTFLTLYSTAAALGVDAHQALRKELARVRDPKVMEKVRKRQAEKREALVGDLKGTLE